MRLLPTLMLCVVCLLSFSTEASLPPDSNLPQGVAIGSLGFDELLAKQLGSDSLTTAALPEGGFQQTNKIQALSARITAQGVSFDSIGGSAGKGGFDLSLLQWGREGALRAADSSTIYRDGDVVFRTHTAGIAEKFSNTSNGIQQDFIVPIKPAGGGALQVQLAINGATPSIKNNGVALNLHGSQRTLTYNRLKVTDAKGSVIPAYMQLLASNRISIVVDDSVAQYPLTIDPTVGDANWVSMAGLQGVSGIIYTMVRSGTDIYVAGLFSAAGNTPATNIAKWDGTSWSALGDGLSAEVWALAVDGKGNLYAGGEFTSAGNLTVNHIAKWNGGNWSALDSGTNNSVYALTVDGNGELYVGGKFSLANGASTGPVAKWNGNRWYPVGVIGGGALSGQVKALVVDADNNVYAGGAINNFAYKYLAKWDGTSWSALGAGINGEVTALVADGSGNIYVGGAFTTAGGVSSNRIAQWNGSNWNALGTGMNNTVAALAVDDSGHLYAGGVFTTAGGVTANSVAQWNGSAWSALGSGAILGGANRVYALSTGTNGVLYAGGAYTSVNGDIARNIAAWDGSNWSAIGSGMNGEIKTLAADASGNLYAGGVFTIAAGVAANHIAKWDGSGWSALGSGMNDVVNSLVVDSSGNLYAGGKFTLAGGVSVNSIAKWDGSNWSALGSGITGCYPSSNCVHALVIDGGGNLYAGGGFATAGGIADVNSIAKWDGSTWSALGVGAQLCSAFPCVHALEIDSNGNLYAGGSFERMGGIPLVRNIAKWDGSAWSKLGTGTNNTVYALAVDSADNIFAGGSFDNVSGVSASRVAKWDGSSWSALGAGVDNRVSSLVIDAGDNLYVGGYFNGSYPIKNIGKWDGSNWSELGSGLKGCNVEPCVSALEIDSSGDLYAGGEFTIAGGKASAFIAKWLLVDADGDGVGDELDAFPADPTESADTDNDGIGDVVDTDDDNDSVSDDSDNCLLASNDSQIDSDLDGMGDACDTDDDNDSVVDAVDNCISIANTYQLDWNEDGIGDACGDPVIAQDFVGSVTKDKAGFSVAFAGDFNNDGYGDYVIGMPGYDIPATQNTKIIKDAGRAVVISGKDGDVLASINGSATKDAMGFAVGGNADINNDGYDDVIVGAPYAENSGAVPLLKDSGSATVIYGGFSNFPNRTFYGEAAKAQFGAAVVLGDLDADRYAEILIGAPTDTQYFPITKETLKNGSVTISNFTSNYAQVQKIHVAGSSIAIGKVNNRSDYISDIIIGDPNADTEQLVDAGIVYVYRYQADQASRILTGTSRKQLFGKSVAVVNLNNDSYDDILIGSPGDDDVANKRIDAGSVTFHFGAFQEAIKKYGSVAKAGLGNSIVVGDIDGDGYHDVIAGASKDDSPTIPKITKDTGSVSIWSGDDYSPIGSALYGSVSKDYFGTSVSVGDINGDGKADLIVGIPGFDIPAAKVIKDGGGVQIISSADL